MDKIRIKGGHPLSGSVQVSGSKNAALPILCSALLSDQKCHFRSVPNLQDIHSTMKLLGHLGVQINDDLKNHEVTLSAHGINHTDAPYDLVRKMRASVLVLGPLLSRFGKAKVSLPGGCAIGARPINFHLEGLKKLGAEILLEEGYVFASARKLIGNRVRFDFPSVGATENLMMAATLAQGETVLENCAQEPEITNLADALVAMGSEIEGQGTSTIRIQGRPSLGACDFRIMGDRIEAGTLLASAFMAQGQVRVEGIEAENLQAVLDKFSEAGGKISHSKKGEPSWIEVEVKGRPKAIRIETQPFPGFPTDMQAQFMAIMAIAEGRSEVMETIFENRFMHVPELCRLGAVIEAHGNKATVEGQLKLKGAPVMATDLRASACLILAGLIAEGETSVSRVYHLDRGYEKLEAKLAALGAQIERIPEKG